MKCMLLVHEDTYGGGSHQTWYILQELCRHGLEAVLISNSREFSLGKRLESSQLPVKTYFSSFICRAVYPIRDFLAFCYILRTMRAEKPDIVLLSGTKLMGLGGIAAWLCGIRKRYAVIRGQGAAPSSPVLPLIYLMERLLAMLGTRYVTVCDYNRREMLEQRICRPDQIVTVHNGTDLQAARSGTPGRLRMRHSIPEGAFVVGMAGRLALRQKRYDLFILMMARLCEQFPHVHGLLIGDGEDEEWLREQIEATGFSDRIHITGYIKDMPDAYAELDLSVLFTEYEGLSNTLLESAAAGIPLIAENVCGNAEIVTHNENGFIILKEDVRAAVHYATMLIRDPDLCRSMGAAGRRRAEAHFDRDIQIRRMIEVITR